MHDLDERVAELKRKVAGLQDALAPLAAETQKARSDNRSDVDK